jgi:hypothetical protein
LRFLVEGAEASEAKQVNWSTAEVS